ncbi:DegT/DnrJ/EryC1/StrS family aminotransferase [Acinetobacter bereziniae]|uniref:DegT/DnrJ/EryC1/StrS family aminotransferase n=1 Tax=Acinetobacter bereziniae TaxID=106648 RepID=UPI00124FD8CA|nr:DegT/DnrJ/EryC1/StrS family aminotransferase [Acinetobacter bereziniae]
MKKEIPPTNGLTVELSDLFSFNSSMDLATQLSQLLNIPKPALTCSGTVALIIALQTLQKKQPNRQQVIIPAWTCPLVALAIEKIGLIPILCDVEQANLNLDLCQLQRLTNTNTLAIVVTHFAGLVYNFSLVQEIAQHYQTFIIEDAAQSMGATVSQQSVGLIGDIAFFSMAFGKGLSSAEGGVLFSRHADLHQDLIDNAKKLPVLRYWEIKRCFELIGYSFLYQPTALTWLYGNPLRKALNNHDEIAAVGDDFDLNSIPVHQLGKWRSQVAMRASKRLPVHWQQARTRAKKRIAQLQLLPNLHVFDESENTLATFPFLICYVENKVFTQKILDQVWKEGLGITQLFVRSISHYPALSHIQADTPNAIQFAAQSFTISNSFWLDDLHFQKIFKVLECILTA